MASWAENAIITKRMGKSDHLQSTSTLESKVVSRLYNIVYELIQFKRFADNIYKREKRKVMFESSSVQVADSGQDRWERCLTCREGPTLGRFYPHD